MLSSQFPSRSSDRFSHQNSIYDGVSKSFRTGLLECKLQMVQLSTTRCSCIAILWVSLVSFTAIPSVLLPSECLLLLLFCVVFQRVFVVVIVYFVIDSVRKLLDTPSYLSKTYPQGFHILHNNCPLHCLFRDKVKGSTVMDLSESCSDLLKIVFWHCMDVLRNTTYKFGVIFFPFLNSNPNTS